MQPKSFHKYVDQIEHQDERKVVPLHEVIQPPDPALATDTHDPEIAPEIIDPTEANKPTEQPPDTQLQESFFVKLLERLEQIAVSQPVPEPDSSDRIDKLYEMEQSMLTVLHHLNERVDAVVTQADQATSPLCEVLVNQQTMMEQITETQTYIINAVIALTEKIESLTAQAAPVVNPVVNVPAPVVNVTMQEGKRVTKTIERDDRGLISKITEGYAFDAD